MSATPTIGEVWYLPVVVAQVNGERALCHLLTPDGEADLPDQVAESGRTFGLPILVPVAYLRTKDEAEAERSEP